MLIGLGRGNNNEVKALCWVWDPSTLAMVAMQQPILEAGSVTVAGTIAVSNWPTTYQETPLSTWVSTAVTLTDADTAYKLPTSEQSGRRTIVVYNGSDTDCYVGSSAVTTSTGILISSGQTISLDASAGVYGICGSAGKILRVLEGK